MGHGAEMHRLRSFRWQHEEYTPIAGGSMVRCCIEWGHPAAVHTLVCAWQFAKYISEKGPDDSENAQLAGDLTRDALKKKVEGRKELLVVRRLHLPRCHTVVHFVEDYVFSACGRCWRWRSTGEVALLPRDRALLC